MSAGKGTLANEVGVRVVSEGRCCMDLCCAERLLGGAADRGADTVPGKEATLANGRGKAGLLEGEAC